MNAEAFVKAAEILFYLKEYEAIIEARSETATDETPVK